MILRVRRSAEDSQTRPSRRKGLAIVAGPTVAPVIGAAVTNSYLGWRWTEVRMSESFSFDGVETEVVSPGSTSS